MRKGAAALIIFSIGFLGIQVQAEDRFELKKETYIYRSEGKRDPFLSIITAAKEIKKKKKKKLVPTEDYDLSQMALIAIVWGKDTRYALVGLPNGKYYTIRTGMPLGIHGGKVMRITEKTVLVREFIPDYKGRLSPQDTVLKLHKEEGK